MKRLGCLLVLFLLLQGCSDMNVSNPFEPSTANVNDVYFDEFPDVPIPVDMTVNRKQSTVSVTSEGVKVGMITAEGRVDKLSLTSATIHSMAKHGWSLRGMVHGARSMQLFEKDNRFAVFYFYDQTLSVAMEVWVVGRLPDGVSTASEMPMAPAGASPAASSISGSGAAGSSTPLRQ